MKLSADGKIEFGSCKDLVEYIKSFDRIECERDVSSLEGIVQSHGLIQEPTIEDYEGEISASEGELDDANLSDIIAGMQDGIPGMLPSFTDDGIVLTAKIGAFEFYKSGRFSQWKCANEKAFNELPIGYTDEEFDAEIESYDNVSDVNELVSAVLDDAVKVDEMFHVEYRTFRSVDDDIATLVSLLDDLEYDGFYTDWRTYEWPDGVENVAYDVYGWRDGMEIPYEDFKVEDLISSDEAAEYIAKSVGILPAERYNPAKVNKA